MVMREPGTPPIIRLAGVEIKSAALQVGQLWYFEEIKIGRGKFLWKPRETFCQPHPYPVEKKNRGQRKIENSGLPRISMIALSRLHPRGTASSAGRSLSQ
jgi:hypothetical protein